VPKPDETRRRVEVVLSPKDFESFEHLCDGIDISRAGLARILVRYGLNHVDEAMAESARLIMERRKRRP
jgi:hypothetical protein